MPQIRDYESKVRAAGIPDDRVARAEDFGSYVGQGLENLGKGIETAASNVREHEARLELSDTTTQMAKHLADKTQEWQETLRTADPGDKQFAQKFLDRYNQDTDQLASDMDLSSPEAKKHFADLRAEQTKHFAVTAIMGQAQLVGEKAKLDRVQTLDSLQNTVRQDPSAIDVAMGQYRQSQEAFIQNGGSREALLKLEETEVPALYTAKAMGEIRQNPDVAILNLESGAYAKHLSSPQVEALIHHANEFKRGQDADQQRQKRADQEAISAAQEVTMKKGLDMGVKGELSWDWISKSNLDASAREHLLRFMEVRAQAPVKTNQQVFNDTIQRINLPDDDPRKITDEKQLLSLFTDGKIAYEGKNSLQDLRAEFSGSRTTDGKAFADTKRKFLKEWENTLTKSNKSMGIVDPDGDALVSDMYVKLEAESQRVRSEGKNIRVLFDRTSSDYFGKFVIPRTGPEIMTNLADKIRAQSQTPPPIPDGMKLQRNKKTGETRLVPK